jgi:hypothetical protein
MGPHAGALCRPSRRRRPPGLLESPVSSQYPESGASRCGFGGPACPRNARPRALRADAMTPVPHAKYDHICSGRRLAIEAMIQL